MYNLFFPFGVTNNYMHSPHHNTAFSNVPSFTKYCIESKIQKGRPKCIIKQKYKYYTRMLPSSWKTSTSELKKKDGDKQPQMYAKPCVRICPSDLQVSAWSPSNSCWRRHILGIYRYWYSKKEYNTSASVAILCLKCISFCIVYCLIEPTIHCKQYVCYTRMTIQ